MVSFISLLSICCFVCDIMSVKWNTTGGVRVRIVVCLVVMRLVRSNLRTCFSLVWCCLTKWYFILSSCAQAWPTNLDSSFFLFVCFDFFPSLASEKDVNLFKTREFHHRLINNRLIANISDTDDPVCLVSHLKWSINRTKDPLISISDQTIRLNTFQPVKKKISWSFTYICPGIYEKV